MRFVVWFVWFPCFLALTAVTGRFLYLATDPFFPMLDSAFLARPHNISWAIAALWQVGPGLHLSMLGFLLISTFLSRMTFGLTSLPVSLPAPHIQSLDDEDRWARIWFFILFSCTCLFLIRIIAGLPFLGFWFLARHAGLIDAQGVLIGRAGWFVYVPGPLGVATIAAIAAWAVGKYRWKSLREFLRFPAPKYWVLAVLFPAALRYFVPLILYAEARIVWVTREFGAFYAPLLGSYFKIPATSAFANDMPAAFFEEVAWRGFLLPRFVVRYGMYRGLFFVSLAWGAYHLQADFSHLSSDGSVMSQIFWRLATCVALGFVFGWLALRSGSIWPAAIAHGLYNVALQIEISVSPSYERVLNLASWAALAWLLFRFWPPEPVADPSPEPLLMAPEFPT
jgi:membrane protease YdiL (CAAX protease family)